MKIRISVISLILVSLASCGANISPSMTPPIISAPLNMADVGKGAMVFIEEVRDERGQAELGQTATGTIATIGSVPSTVREGLEDLFKKSGYSVTDSAPVVLQTSLQQWDVDVSGRLSSSIVSNAKLTIQVYDPANRLAYTGKYQGNAQIQQSSVDDKIVKEALSASINQVLEQIAADKSLMKLLAAF
jgi:uncharacterized lipoprotein YajG